MYRYDIWHIGDVKHIEVTENQKKDSPPQQKPTAPIAETPLLFKASSNGFAASDALIYQYTNEFSSEIF